jgi:amino acid transporter
VGALVSAVPRLQPHTLPICLATLTILTVANLRGVREAGALFALPTSLFIGSLLGTIGPVIEAPEMDPLGRPV